MLDLTKIVRDFLLTQTTVTDLVGSRIYMPFSPNTNLRLHYPFITIETDDGSTDSLTNDYTPDLLLHIWTKDDGRVTLGNEIARQVLLVLDRKGFLNQTPKIYQIWKDGAPHVFEDDEQTYHKMITFSVVMEGYGGPSHPCD